MAKVVLNRAGMSALLQSDEVGRILLAEAQPVAERARANVPGSSTWAASISTTTVRHPSRVVARVQSDHPLAAIFEFGTGPRYTAGGQFRGAVAPQAPLTRAVS